MTVFFRVIEFAADRKAGELLRAVAAVSKCEAQPATVFECEPAEFSVVPASPFAYWVSESVRTVFRRYPRFDRDNLATRGAYTTDDFKYYRLTWEVPQVERPRTRDDTCGAQAYVPLAKGGAYSPFYSDIHLAVRWHDDGAEPKVFLSMYRERKGWGTDWSACLNGYGHYFRPGLTWPRRTQGGFGMRVMPAGCIFADKGPAAFVEGDGAERLLSLLAITTSAAFRALVALQMAFGSYEVGVIQRTPVPELSGEDVAKLAVLARRAWSLKRSLDTVNETSHAFVLPPGVNERLTGLDRDAIGRELESIQKLIDETAFALYGISLEDRAAMEASSKRDTSDAEAAEDDGDDNGDDAVEDVSPTGAAADASLSWLVGIAFGRFDPRLATGARAIPPEPEPFDPLPPRSPGMWPEGEEPADYPEILVDDRGHTSDLIARVRAVADLVHVDLPENVRGWLAKEFFPLHIKMYSKSRRKAPIYWQLATPSASYSIWLYIHAFSKDTLFRVQNDYAAPKLTHEERRLESLTSELRDKATAAQRKELAAQEAIVEELRAFLEDVKRVAPLWKPNLDDGVVINFAPLWRLVPQNKSWQKELKSTWDALCEGKYDWAHLAMHLWPERVVPRCAKDRSLAIAHGLEDVFWVEGTDGKWTARKMPTRSVDELVRERTSPAVKSALKSLLDAPVATGKSAGRGRGGRRKAAATAEGGDA